VLSPLLAYDPALKAWRKRKCGKYGAHGRLPCRISVLWSIQHAVFGPVSPPSRICATYCQTVTNCVSSHHFGPLSAPCHKFSAHHSNGICGMLCTAVYLPSANAPLNLAARSQNINVCLDLCEVQAVIKKGTVCKLFAKKSILFRKHDLTVIHQVPALATWSALLSS
jgi:hypothetical protein